MTKNRMVASRTQAVLRASASAARGGLPGVVDRTTEASANLRAIATICVPLCRGPAPGGAAIR